MTTEAHDPAAELRGLIKEGRISEEAVLAITGMPAGRLRSFLAGSTAILQHDEAGRLSLLVAHLVAGTRVDDDERVRAIIEALTLELRLTLENIAALTGLELGDLEAFLADPGSVPAERRYTLAVRLSHLLLAAAQARPR